MKTEFLKSQGLTEEQITAIMAENGKDIAREQTKATQATEKVSQELENLKSKLDEKDQLLADANSQIEKFKGMDIESKDKAIQEYQEKYKAKEEELKTKEAEYQKQLQQKDYEFKVNDIIGQHKFVDDFAKDAFKENLIKQQFKFGEDGTLQGANDYINKFKEDHKGIFVVEEAPKNEPPLPTFTTQTTQTTQPKAKMGLLEAMKLKNANPNAEINFN